MAKIKLLPHHEICPQGATFETQEDESICEAALRNNIKIVEENNRIFLNNLLILFPLYLGIC